MRLRALVDQLSAMLAYWDSSERCRFASRAYREWLGLEPESMVGLSMRELLGPLYDPTRPFIEAVLRGQPQEFEQLIPDPRGGPARYSLSQYLPDVGARGVRGFFALSADVSSLKRAQAALLESERKLQASERLAALGTLAGRLAHEVNNPLTTVTLSIQLALEQLEADHFDGSLVQADLREAKVGAERIARIVRSLQPLTRAASQEDATLDVNKLLDESIALVSKTLLAHARVEREYSEVGGVKGDAEQLMQVFVSLLNNAEQAVLERDSALVRVRTSTDDGAVRIEIADNGCGIPDTVQSSIFDPFFTTRPVGTAMGLGLCIAAAIVKGLGGDLTFSSRVGSGTVFRIVLPKACHRASGGEPRAIPLAPRST